MKTITYKGNKIEKPENVSLNLIKELIDMGGDYGLTVQQIVDLINRKYPLKNLKNATNS